MLRTNNPHRKRAVIASFGFIASVLGVSVVPGMTASLVQNRSDNPHLQEQSNQRDRALRIHRQHLRGERQFWDAMSVYRSLGVSGITNLILPQVNDPSTYKMYLDPEAVQRLLEAGHGSAPDDPHAALQLLSEKDRDLVEKLVETTRCPERLARSRSQELLDLCKSLLEYRRIKASSRVIERAVPNQDLKVLQRRIDMLRSAPQVPRTHDVSDRLRPNPRSTKAQYKAGEQEQTVEQETKE